MSLFRMKFAQAFLGQDCVREEEDASFMCQGIHKLVDLHLLFSNIALSNQD